MKTEVLRILEKRVDEFEKTHHSYEAKEVKSAIDTIKRLVPPELFVMHSVVVDEDVCDCWDEHWSYDESGVDMYCTRCEPKSEVALCECGNTKPHPDQSHCQMCIEEAFDS